MKRPSGKPKLKQGVKFKEPEAKGKTEGGLFIDLFALKKAELVALQKESLRDRETLPPASPEERKNQVIKPEVTSASKIRSGQVKTVDPRHGSRGKEQGTPVVRYALLFILVMIMSYGIKAHRQKAAVDSLQVIDPVAEKSMRESVNYFRNETGRRLNRERINVEYENESTAPEIKMGAKAPADADMMSGLPLNPEPYHRTTSRDRAEPANPDFSDDRIRYSLREQQLANEWESRARKAYIDEFIANAAKAGYRVQVDKNGVVKILGRTPAAAGMDSGKLPAIELPQPFAPPSGGLAR